MKVVATASVLITEVPEETTPPIETVTIDPSPIVVDPGESIQLSAEALGVQGQPLSGIEFVWASSDLRGGAVTDEGVFQVGTRPGGYDDSITVTGIQHTHEGIKFAGISATVTVVGERPVSRLASVALIPENPTLLKQQIFRMRAIGFDDDGMVIPAVNFVWKINDSKLGRMNDIGYLTVEADEGSYPGAVTVTGIWEGANVSVTTDITVVNAPEEDDFLQVHALPRRFFLNPGDQLRLRAVALNGLGELAAGTELRWDMKDARAGKIDGRGNFVAGDEPGVYTEAVRVEAVVPGERGFVRATDFASVVIRRKPTTSRLHAASVVLRTVVVAPGGRATLTVRAADEYGDPAKNVVIHWETLNEQVGEVNELGVFKAGSSPGIYAEELQATIEQRLGEEVIVLTKTVKVIITGTLTKTDVQPHLATVAPGRTVHFSLTGWDETLLPGLVVIWKLSDERIGTIDAFGNFTAGKAPGLHTEAIRAEVTQRLARQR